MDEDFGRFTLENQKAGAELLEVGIQIHEALEQEPDPVQPGTRGTRGKCIGVGFHVMRVDDEEGVEAGGGLGGVLESRVVVDPEAFAEPHQRTRPGRHFCGFWTPRIQLGRREKRRGKSVIFFFLFFWRLKWRGS